MNINSSLIIHNSSFDLTLNYLALFSKRSFPFSSPKRIAPPIMKYTKLKVLKFIAGLATSKVVGPINTAYREPIISQYFDSVPRLLIPDNLKTGVVSHKKYEDPVLNKSYQEMAEYYGITVIPARVRMPKDKAAVEGSVGNITNAVIGHLRNRKFFSLEELNKAIRKELEVFNTNPFQKRDGSRLSVYEDELTI